MSTGVLKTPHDVGTPPRVVRTKWRLSWAVFGYILVMAIPGWLGGMSAVQLYVLTHGTPIQAMVESSRTTMHRDNTDFRVSYGYELDGQAHHDEQKVDFQTYQNARLGQKVAGRATNLWGHYFSETELSDVHYDAMEGIGASGLAVAMMLLMPWSIWRRNKRVVESGLAATGTITRKWTTYGRSSLNYRLAYAFDPKDGESVAGRKLVNRWVYNANHEGHAITVIYDPGRPRRHVVYEFSNFEVVKG
jgi:hypothetical protein